MPPIRPPRLEGLGPLLNFGIETEIIYAFVIIVCSLMIYFGTKELYELSSYKGIKYFRQAFLFFAIAYFFRSFIKLIIGLFNVSGIIDVHPDIWGPAILFVFMYLSSMSIFYLLYSVMWKRWNKDSNKIVLFHILAIVIAGLSIISRNPLAYLILNIILFIFIIFIVYISYKSSKTKKVHNMYVVYLLLSVFWIFNILDILIPKFFRTFQLFIYLSSIGIFLLILYKVLKKTG
jgi:hypothetical protein